ncbi:phage tail spike protein [Clostridium butyricum]|uniref:phage tail spike protein n=1 Tax=Clostridium butyricum TaxID=1492 RepID=UPI0013D8094B|nr:phage tail spike protein [Clostridium butyricum]MCQ2017482.1 phage tail protein [Clostridium butyricum]MCQ2023044.1 phage tail protein [Clostridium butyricum]NFB71946.1 hypothetical protein [Clostridium butyricum]NFB91922.1 hypothetical protein [Clostridium butyricum]UTY53313.1 hypothetical protein HNS01_09520 [Clostridium butyricum]
MIRLFRNNETDFTHNEWVLNEIIECKVTEELKGDYTAELQYPLEDKGISSNLIIGSVATIPTMDNRQDQQFRIIDKDTSNGTIAVQIQAKLLADLKENRLKAMTLTGMTRKQAIQAVLNAALDPHNYKVGNLDTNTNTNVIVNIPEGSVLNALIGNENSILSEYGGEFIVNNNSIDIIDRRGDDNGVVIEYGKNLSSISEKTDNIDLATVLIPKCGDYRLPEYYIESPNVNKYEKRYFKEVELNFNIWDGENEKGEDQITLAEAYSLMRLTCNKMFTEDKVDQITFNYEINFIELSKTEEYKNYAVLETVNLGDTVTVRHKKLNLDLQARVNKISYTVDCEGNKTIDTVEIGFTRKEITDIIKDTAKQIKFAKDEIKMQVKNDISKVNSELKIQDGKISAVVESEDGGMTWQLSKSAFIVACTGASNSNVTIDANGLTVNNNKIRLKNSSGDTVFYVNTKGKCNADGGFIVDDGNASCYINSSGIKLTGSNGNIAKIEIIDDSDYSGTYIRDDLYVEDVCRIFGKLRVHDTAWFYKKVYVGDESLEDMIIRLIEEYAPSSKG